MLRTPNQSVSVLHETALITHGHVWTVRHADDGWSASPMLSAQASRKTARALHSSTTPMPARTTATYCRGMPHMRVLLFPVLRSPGALSGTHSGKHEHVLSGQRSLWHIVGGSRTHPRLTDEAVLFCILCTSAGFHVRMSRSRRSLQSTRIIRLRYRGRVQYWARASASPRTCSA